MAGLGSYRCIFDYLQVLLQRWWWKKYGYNCGGLDIYFPHRLLHRYCHPVPLGGPLPHLWRYWTPHLQSHFGCTSMVCHRVVLPSMLRRSGRKTLLWMLWRTKAGHCPPASRNTACCCFAACHCAACHGHKHQGLSISWRSYVDYNNPTTCLTC